MKQHSASKQPPPPSMKQSQVGGRNANILTPSMLKKVTLQQSSDANGSICPFSGYNSFTLTQSAPNPQQEQSIDPQAIKDLISSEVNTRCKIIMDRNQKLEEELRAYSTRMQQMETSFNTSLSEIQSSREQYQQQQQLLQQQSSDESMISLNDLSRQYDSMKDEFDALQAAFKTEIRSKIQETLREKDLESYIQANNNQLEAKIALIEDQFRIFSSKPNSASNSPTKQQQQPTDHLTIKRLQADQLKTASEISALKQQLLSARQNQQYELENQLDTSLTSVRGQMDSLSNSVAAIKGEIREKLNESANRDQLDSQIDLLRRSVRELFLERESQNRLQLENEQLEAQITKYQRDTTQQIEEMRRLVLSNPEILMEASRVGFFTQPQNPYSNTEQDYYQEQSNQISGDNVYNNLLHSFSNNNNNYIDNNLNTNVFQNGSNSRTNDIDEDDMVEIATFGNDAQLQEDNERFQMDIMRSLSFGDRPEIETQSKAAAPVPAAAEPMIRVVNPEITVAAAAPLPEYKTPTIIVQEPIHQENQRQEQNVQTKLYDNQRQSFEANPANNNKDFDEMHINYSGISDFLNKNNNQSQYESPNRNSDVHFTTGIHHQNILADLGFNRLSDIENNGSNKKTNSEEKIPVSPSRPAGPSFEEYLKQKVNSNTKLEGQDASHQARVSVDQTPRISGGDDDDIEVPVEEDFQYNQREQTLRQPATELKQATPAIAIAAATEEDQDVGAELRDDDEDDEDDGVQLYFSSERKAGGGAYELSTIQHAAILSNFASDSSEIPLPKSAEALAEVIPQIPRANNFFEPASSSIPSAEPTIIPETNAYIEQINNNQMLAQDNYNQLQADAEDEQSNKSSRPEPEDEDGQQGEEMIIDSRGAQAPTQLRNTIFDSTISSNNDDDQEEVVYQIDDDGYLMDENGNYILGDDGQMVKLLEEEINYLRQTNMLED